jgi:hypothetical protein
VFYGGLHVLRPEAGTVLVLSSDTRTPGIGPRGHRVMHALGSDHTDAISKSGFELTSDEVQ